MASFLVIKVGVQTMYEDNDLCSVVGYKLGEELAIRAKDCPAVGCASPWQQGCRGRMMHATHDFITPFWGVSRC